MNPLLAVISELVEDTTARGLAEALGVSLRSAERIRRHVRQQAQMGSRNGAADSAARGFDVPQPGTGTHTGPPRPTPPNYRQTPAKLPPNARQTDGVAPGSAVFLVNTPPPPTEEVPPNGGDTSTPPASKRVRKHVLPDDWQPKSKHVERSAKLGVDLRLEAESFENWARSKGERKVDWDLAFTNWLIRVGKERARQLEIDRKREERWSRPRELNQVPAQQYRRIE